MEKAERVAGAGTPHLAESDMKVEEQAEEPSTGETPSRSSGELPNDA